MDVVVVSPPGVIAPAVAIAGCRAGGLGVLNLDCREHAGAKLAAVREMAGHINADFGIKLGGDDQPFIDELAADVPAHLHTVILTCVRERDLARTVDVLHKLKLSVLLEATSQDQARLGAHLGIDGLVAKGHEAGGRVGNETAFILLQQFVSQFSLPVWVQGGIGLHSAPACIAGGAVGVVLDSQLALTRESALPATIRSRIAAMDGSETIYLGEQLGDGYRAFYKPGSQAVEELRKIEQQLAADARPQPEVLAEWRQAICNRTGWDSLQDDVLPLGQDAAFAASLAARFKTVGGVIEGIREAIRSHGEAARRLRPLDEASALAQSHGTRYPILQGPMTRVSDSAAFAASVANTGGLPFLALALMRGPEVTSLLKETQLGIQGKPWGVGILGFVPAALRREQVDAILAHKPPYALIAGGRPDQARVLEREGIPTYLHVPSPGLLKLFLHDGARRFVFEGRECGGHVGPRTSFVLWSQMIDVLCEALDADEHPEHFHVVFAGGIHDALSSAMVAVMAAPLAARGARVGVLMGSAYLFTEEAVASGAIVKSFQDQALACNHTVLLESGPGHATRCVDSVFAQTFAQEKKRLLESTQSPEEIRLALENLNLGRLRIAAKGITRNPQFGKESQAPKFATVDMAEQNSQGMYMIGQVAALRKQSCTVQDLHHDVAVAGSQRLAGMVNDLPAARVSGHEDQPCDIAIIGMACVMPQAPDIVTYWDNILNKVDAITEVPAERWDWRLYFDPEPSARDKIYSKWGGFIDDVAFDPMRYGMPPASLPSIEPAQLLTLEVVRAALDDAGYAERPFPREHTSVILGAGGGAADLGLSYGARAFLPRLDQLSGLSCTAQDIIDRLGGVLPEWTEDSFAGILTNVSAGRISNRFDLGGGNYTVDAACASSLAAVSMAVKELESRTSDMAIVGGVDTMQNPFTYLCFSKTHALSPRGRCRTFDETADGIVISEGIGIMILKRLADAERDGDRIYAVIKGVGNSSDGKDKGLTAPRPEGQMRALRRAYAKAGVSPASVGLIEAHGTGTVAGDQAEVQALIRVFSEADANRQSCAIGSVKSMIGHTKCTAGAAGLIKAASSLYHKVLPPTLGVEHPNSKVNFPETPFYVSSEARPWVQANNQPRRAGVSAFGFGGTNFHVVVEEYQGYATASASAALHQWPSELFLFKAPSRQTLVATVEHWQRVLARGTAATLRDLAFTLWNQGAQASAADKDSQSRLAVVAASVEDLQEKLGWALAAFAKAEEQSFDDHRGLYFTEQPLADSGKIAFLFSGQGSQYPNMLRDLAIQFPEVRVCFERADQALAQQLEKPLSAYVFPPPAFTTEETRACHEALTQTNIAQPAIGAAGVAMFELLADLGVHADLAAGHSYGEYIALSAAGVFSAEALMALSEARGRFMVAAAGAEPGSMAAVRASAETVRAGVKDIEGVCVANMNAPDQTVISGTRAAVEQALEGFKAREIHAQQLPVACAFHSPIVAPAQAKLAEFLATLPLSPPRIPVYSNTTGAPHAQDPDAIASQLVDHLLRPVDFVGEVEAMYDAGARIFVEVGPRNVLSGLAEKILADRPKLIAASDQSGRSGLVQLLHLLGKLAVQGVPVVLDRLYRHRALSLLDAETLGTEDKQPAPTAWWVNGARATPLKQAAAASNASHQAVIPSHHQVERTSTALPESGEARLTGAARSELDRQAPDGALSGQAAHRRVATPAQPVMPAAVPRDAPVTPAAEPHDAPVTPADAPDGVQDVMSQFQQMMTHFLDTQRSVMLSYLEGTAETTAAEQTPRAAATPADAIMPDTSPDLAVAPLLHAATPVSQAQALPEAPAPVPSGAEQPDKEALAGRLLAIVSERTGYPPDMLRLDLDLEADLGIDSIKRVEILGNFQESLGAAAQQDAEEMMEKLAGVKTLGGIIEWIEARLSPATEGGTGDAESAVMEAAAVDTQQLTQRLLAIVSERTGYPPDMLRLDLDLEADLGIDSIKRVEILGNFQESLGAAAQQDAEEMMEKLAGAKTLGGIIEWIEDRLSPASEGSTGNAASGHGDAGVAGKPPTASEQTQASDTTTIGPGVDHDDRIQRYTLAPVASPLQEPDADVAKDSVVVVTDDGRDVARTLAGELRRRGYRVALVQIGHGKLEVGQGSYVSGLASLDEAGQLVDLIRSQGGPIGAIVHLYPLARQQSLADMDLQQWKHRLNAETKSLFYLAKAARDDLMRAGTSDGACLMAATAMGGTFATSLPTAGFEFFPGQGGVHGLLKTLALEWPEVRVKAVDLDPQEAPATLVNCLCDELLSGKGDVAVGYEGSRRVVLRPVLAPLGSDCVDGVAIDSSSVILVTGGARGVTADAACYLAERHQPTLVLVGRSPLPAAEEPAETADLSSAQDVKAALIKRLRQGGQSVTPAQVEADYNRLLKDRDMRSKLAAMKQAGAKVHYHQVDVCDAGAFEQLIDEVYTAFGRLDGVIHGAGVIEDKLIEDKTPESFDRVFDTKVDSAFVLSRKLRPDALQFLVLFSSVAGCFGNRGQADYAAANEVLNKLARHLDRHWPARVVAINWGPWATAGMVSAALEKQFAERGVALIPRRVGQRLLDEELTYGCQGEAEVIIGGAGWQTSVPETPTQSAGGLPLVGEMAFSRPDAGAAEEVTITLDAARDLYLRDHQIDEQPVLPMAVAMELMAEIVAGRFPELQVSAVKDLRVLQGVVLENGPETLRVTLQHHASGDRDPAHVRVAIVAGDDPRRVHYQATVELDQRLATAPSFERLSLSDARSFPKPVDELYRDWLFHGQLFRGITRIEQIGTNGVKASIVASSPDRWLAGPSRGQWLIDPLMIDSGLQLLIVWAREHWDMTPLPSRFHAYRRFGAPCNSHMSCEVHIKPNTRGHIIHADLYFLDADGRLLGILEDMEGTCSKALNRLAGNSALSNTA